MPLAFCSQQVRHDVFSIVVRSEDSVTRVRLRSWVLLRERLFAARAARWQPRCALFGRLLDIFTSMRWYNPRAGVAGVSIAMIGASKPLEYYVNCLKGSPALLFLAKLSVATPLTYHYIGGLRHLVRELVGVAVIGGLAV